MKPHFQKDFEHNYQNDLKRPKLNGMQPKTLESLGLETTCQAASFHLAKSIREATRTIQH